MDLLGLDERGEAPRDVRVVVGGKDPIPSLAIDHVHGPAAHVRDQPARGIRRGMERRRRCGERTDLARLDRHQVGALT